MKVRQVRAGVWIVLGCLSLGPGCATTKVAGSGATSVDQATLTVAGRQYRLDACSSGDLLQFLGVDLADATRTAFARVAIDPIDGPRMKVVLGGADGKETFVLGKDQCDPFEAGVKPTDWQVNDVRDVSGFVDADCKSDRGPAVSLHARFNHCH